jgi:NADPH-dependent 2,4-dienoyl-CoA reductase/sulfur reductase-like enzyme
LKNDPQIVAVEEKILDELPYNNLSLVQGVAVGLDTAARRLLLADGEPIPYDKLCVCTGARPKGLGVASPHVLTLRDDESVQALCARLLGARRVMVVGNGGIALELM